MNPDRHRECSWKENEVPSFGTSFLEGLQGVPQNTISTNERNPLSSASLHAIVCVEETPVINTRSLQVEFVANICEQKKCETFLPPYS